MPAVSAGGKRVSGPMDVDGLPFALLYMSRSRHPKTCEVCSWFSTIFRVFFPKRDTSTSPKKRMEFEDVHVQPTQ